MSSLGPRPRPRPAFLTPSREALHSALALLQQREHARRSLLSAARLHRNAQASRDHGFPPQCSGTDWFAARTGTTTENMTKNRYGDILAYDRTRCLSSSSRPAASAEPNYVNASLVCEPDLGFEAHVLPRRWWVAAQAPIPHTVPDFLALLLSPPTSPAYQASGAAPLPFTNLVVQLTPLVEGRRQKCHPYFPSTVGQTARFAGTGPTAESGVWVRLEGKTERDGTRTSELRVGREGDEQGRRVVHVEYLGWRDHGVPDSAPHLIHFLHRLHALNRSLSSAGAPIAPILAHCSAGVGRTGTLLALSSLLSLLSYLSRAQSSLSTLPAPPEDRSHPLGPYPARRILATEEDRGDPPVDYVGATVDGLRDQRTTMCQTVEQVEWVWEAARIAWDEGLLDHS